MSAQKENLCRPAERDFNSLYCHLNGNVFNRHGDTEPYDPLILTHPSHFSRVFFIYIELFSYFFFLSTHSIRCKCTLDITRYIYLYDARKRKCFLKILLQNVLVISYALCMLQLFILWSNWWYKCSKFALKKKHSFLCSCKYFVNMLAIAQPATCSTQQRLANACVWNLERYNCKYKQYCAHNLKIRAACLYVWLLLVLDQFRTRVRRSLYRYSLNVYECCW